VSPAPADNGPRANGSPRRSGNAGRRAVDGLAPFEPPVADAAKGEGRVPVSDDGSVDLDLVELGQVETPVAAEVAPSAPMDLAAAMVAGAPTRRGLKGYLSDLRPSVVTGGESFLPLGLFVALALAGQMGISAQSLLGPEIKDYFGLSITAVTALQTLVGVLVLLLSVPVGYLADRVSRTLLSAIGAALIAIFGVLSGLAPTILLFALARAGSGLGAVAEGPQTSLLADYYPPHTRAGVFAFRTLGTNAAELITPAIAGVIAGLFSWQVVFIIVALVAGVPGLLVYRLPDPPRGYWERRIMGADEQVARKEDRPASVGESFRIVWSVRTLRRILIATPFLAGSISGLTSIGQLYQQQVFGVGVTERGLVQTLTQPFGLVGLLVGGIIANRLLRGRPGRVVTYTGLSAVVVGILIGAEAVSPWFFLVVIFGFGVAFAAAIITPALSSLMSLVVPARVRTFGLSFFGIAVVPGALFSVTAGWVGDKVGLRASLLVMTGVFLLGALILTTAGSGVEPDIRAANASAMAAQAAREARDRGRAKLLVVRDLDVCYDQLQVLFGVDFDVEEGEIIALLGTNGAGKSTLLRAISGTTAPSNGAIYFDGDSITHLPPHEHASRGIVQVPGGRGVFPSLTVGENLRLAAWMFRSDPQYTSSAVEAVLGYFPVLRQRLGTPASELSGGEQQMLTLGQAFLCRPSLLMIDELSLGLAPAIVAQLLDIVRAIHEQGTTIILVEQSVNVALTVAKRAVFMEKGEIRFTGPTAELLARPDILRSVYLKGAGALSGPVTRGWERQTGASEAQDEVLVVDGITKSFGGVKALTDVSFTLQDGRVLGLIGPNGAGKTTLFDVITGFSEPDTGVIRFLGEDVTGLGPDQRAKLGLQRSFQNARLFPALTVGENVAVALDRHIAVRSATMAAFNLPNVKRAEARAARRVDRLVELMGIGDLKDKFVRELSTGQRRLVDMACMLATEPRALLLDEPSSGIAQREAEELGPLLGRIKYETGCSILIIEHDMPLLLSMVDELVALDLGRVITRGAPSEVLEHPHVVESYLGTAEEVINRSGSS